MFSIDRQPNNPRDVVPAGGTIFVNITTVLLPEKTCGSLDCDIRLILLINTDGNSAYSSRTGTDVGGCALKPPFELLFPSFGFCNSGAGEIKDFLSVCKDFHFF